MRHYVLTTSGDIAVYDSVFKLLIC